MAQEFFDYQERDIDKLPDWSKVTGDISDELVKIQRERQDKRDEQDRKTQESLTKLEDIDMGESQTMNELKLKAVEDSKRYLLEQEKLMKQNKLDPNQRLIALQTQMDDWKAFSNVTNEWDKNYSEYLTRMEDGTSAGMEQAMAEWNEEFGNIANKAVKTNGKNGRLYLTTTDGSGEPLSINALNNRLKDRVNKYDINGEVQNQVQKLGQVVKVINKDGILSMDDVRENPVYEEAKEKMIEALLGSDRDTSSILSDYVGGYSFTRDKSMQGKEDENGNEMILLTADKNGTYQPEFTKPQKEKAEEYVELQLEMQLGSKETPKPPKVSSGRTTPEWKYKAKAREKKIAELFQTAVDLASGDEAARTDAINRVKQYTDITNVVKDGDQWIIEFGDKESDVIQSTGDTEMDARSLFKYTVGGSYRDEYGATSPKTAYDLWKGLDRSAGEIASDFGEYERIGRKTAYDIKTEDGSTVGDSIIEIFEGDSPDNIKLASLQGVINTMELPKDIAPTKIIKKLEQLKTLRAVNPIKLIDLFNTEVNELIENYNNSLDQQDGGGQTATEDGGGQTATEDGGGQTATEDGGGQTATEDGGGGMGQY
jgi:hypothetical protein